MELSQSVVPLERIYLLVLTHEAYLDLHSHISGSYPVEACGILLGRSESGMALVTRVVPLRNVRESRTEFWIDEKEWMERILHAGRLGLEYIGLYHSHPDGDPLPSPSDRHRMLECPGEVWLIVGYGSGRFDTAAYRVGDDGYSLFSLPVKISKG